MTEWNDNREQENMEAGPDGREEEQTPELEEQEDGRTERESLRYVYPGKKEPVGRFGSRRWGTRLKMAVLLLLVAVAGFVVGHVILLFASGNGVNNFKVMTKLTMLEAYVDHFFLDETDGSRLEDYIYKGYIAGLDDPYAAYYNEEEYAQLMEEDSGEYVGIGVTVRQDPDTGYVLVEQVNKGDPAYNAGVQADDIIMAVDGEDTAELGLQDTVALIKKNEKPVVLTILRGAVRAWSLPWISHRS